MHFPILTWNGIRCAPFLSTTTPPPVRFVISTRGSLSPVVNSIREALELDTADTERSLGMKTGRRLTTALATPLLDPLEAHSSEGRRWIDRTLRLE